jgi:hypothetical protein
MISGVTARAPVRYGPLRLGEGASLAEDAALDLDGDDILLDDAQRRALDASISMSLQQEKNGEVAPAARILERLRARRR